MLSAMQRLGFMSSATFEHKKLAVEMAEVIIKWELQRIKNEYKTTEVNNIIFVITFRVIIVYLLLFLLLY